MFSARAEQSLRPTWSRSSDRKNQPWLQISILPSYRFASTTNTPAGATTTWSMFLFVPGTQRSWRTVKPSSASASFASPQAPTAHARVDCGSSVSARTTPPPRLPQRSLTAACRYSGRTARGELRARGSAPAYAARARPTIAAGSRSPRSCGRCCSTHAFCRRPAGPLGRLSRGSEAPLVTSPLRWGVATGSLLREQPGPSRPIGSKPVDP